MNVLLSACSLTLMFGSSVVLAQDALISWTAHDITGNVTEISTDGTVVLDGARNGGTSDRTVNGVVFESVANSGNLFDSLFANDNIGNRGYGTVVSDGSYRNFLSQGQRSGRYGTWTLPRIATTTDWTTIEFTNLTVGNSYQVQIWASDVGSSANGIFGNSALVLGDGVSTGDPVFGTDTQILYEASDFGAGQYAIGVFVANATTQTVNVRQYNNLNTSPSPKNSDHFSNGWQIRDQGVDTTAPSPAPTVVTLTPFETSVGIEASTATDQTGVLYRYNRRSASGGAIDFTSDWQESPSFLDTGLTAGTEYFYTVQARDKTPTQYTTAESAEVAVTTLAIDNTPPTPATMSFAVAPQAVDYQSITMTATAASDANGVEYFFDETTGNPGGTDSGWQDSPTYVDDGLDPNTLYTYTVQARDKSVAGNTNTASSAASATTDPKGSATITWAVSDITDDVADVSTDGTLVDARNGTSANERTVNGVTFLNRVNSGDLFDTVFANDQIGGRGWGTVVTDGDYREFLRYGQRSGRNAPNDYAIIEFFGLTPGNTYQIQIWASDVSNSANTAQNVALVLGDGSTGAPVQGTDAQIFHEAAEDGSGVGTAGQYAIGTFVADAPNQAFNVQKYTNLLSSPNAATQDHWSNGWQLRDLGVVSNSPFDDWAANGTLPGTLTFEGDLNGDGVQDGLAFLLGVGNPDDDANSALPTVSEDGSGGLVMSFDCLPISARGDAVLKIEHSSTLGAAPDPWLATVDVVPDADDPTADNGVTFVVTPGPVGPPALNSVTATIASGEASDGKLFGRLQATESASP